MNPFELPGPQFLAFYAVLGAGVLFAVYLLKQRAEGGEPIRLPSTDPYLIAYLRGGATEAVRLGVTVLVDCQLLDFEDGVRVVRRERVKPTHGSNDLERAILEECETATLPGSLATSKRLQEIARRSYRRHSCGCGSWLIPRRACDVSRRPAWRSSCSVSLPQSRSPLV